MGDRHDRGSKVPGSGSPDLLRRTDDMSAPLAELHPPPASPGGCRWLQLLRVVAFMSWPHFLTNILCVCFSLADWLGRAGSSYSVSSETAQIVLWRSLIVGAWAAFLIFCLSAFPRKIASDVPGSWAINSNSGSLIRIIKGAFRY